MRWLSASLAASSCALLLAGCGGGERKHAVTAPLPRIPAAVARQLAAQADLTANAAPGSCTARAAAARLRSEVIDAVQARRVPARYQEQLMTTANDLATRLASCTDPTQRDQQPGKAKGHKKKHEGDD